MDKFIGFDIDHKKPVVCVTQAEWDDRYTKQKTKVGELRQRLWAQRQAGDRLHLTFDASGLFGILYDNLVDVVDRLEISNPTKLTKIYHTDKKNDRIDARKQAKRERFLIGFRWRGVRLASKWPAVNPGYGKWDGLNSSLPPEFRLS